MAFRPSWVGITRRPRGRHARPSQPGRVAAAGGVVTLTAALLTVVAPPPAGAASLAPTADSYVDASSPGSSYGTRTYLKVDASPVLASYLTFDVAAVDDFSSAVLSVYAETGSGSTTGLEVRQVVDTSWTETGITDGNKPAYGAVLDSTGKVTGGWYDLDVSSVVTSNGTYSFAITTPSTTAIRLSSRESTTAPRLVVADPQPGDRFVVAPLGDGVYEAAQDSGVTYTGGVKSVVERAVRDLGADGDGGTVQFTAGTFDLGAEYLRLEDVRDVVFEGAGIDATVLRNYSELVDDTEPFNFSSALRVTIRDLTVVAGGTPRTSSDAIDGDGMNSSRIERVKIAGSRGRGIVLDGKDIRDGAPRTADDNVIKDCVIDDVGNHGIELLAAQGNRVEGCTITDPGRAGIQANKASSSANQANKKASGNQILGNTVTGAGESGIAVNSSDNNLISGNVVSNSVKDGIRVFTGSDGITAVGNRVEHNTATDTRSTKTQVYGLHIMTSLCRQTVIGPGNNLAGNRSAPIRDLGTDSLYL